MQTVDPVNNKKQIKESITNAIAKLVTGSNRDEIALGLKKHTRDFLLARPFLRLSFRFTSQMRKRRCPCRKSKASRARRISKPCTDLLRGPAGPLLLGAGDPGG